MDKLVNYVTAVLCGLALVVAQYFVGRGSYPFLPLPAYGVLCLAAISSIWSLARRNFSFPRWTCISFAAALAAWIALPMTSEPDLWLAGGVLRLVLAAWVVYCLVSFVITGSGERLLLISILLAAAFAQAALGIFQYTFPEAQPYLGWVSDLCPNRMEGHAFRARGFYYNANHLAWLLNFSGAFALAIGVWGRVALWPRVIMFYCAAMFFGAGILTQSRGGLLGAGVALLVFALLSARGVFLGAWGQRGRMFSLVALALLVCFGAAWQAYEASDLAQYRLRQVADESYRPVIWKSALRLWQTEPISGTGIGSFSNAARQYRFRPDGLDDVFAHNDWIQALAEVGLIGVGLGFCTLLLHITSGFRAFMFDLRRRMASGSSPVSLKAALQLGAIVSLAAFGVHSLFDFNMQLPANALLACVSLAILASPNQRITSHNLSLWGYRIGLLSALVSATFLGWLSWKSLRSEFDWIQANVAFMEGNSQLTLELVDEGLLANPKHSGLAALGGRVALSLGKQTHLSKTERLEFLERAVEFGLIATKFDPREAWHKINLAHAYDNFERFELAAPLYLSAMTCAPFYATPYEFYALHLELQGYDKEAVRFYELALQFPGATFSAQRRDALVQLRK
jgi:O-antigen ligase